GVVAGEHGGAGGSTPRPEVGPVEAHPGFRQGVEVGSLHPRPRLGVAADRLVRLVVGEDEEDVWPLPDLRGVNHALRQQPQNKKGPPHGLTAPLNPWRRGRSTPRTGSSRSPPAPGPFPAWLLPGSPSRTGRSSGRTAPTGYLSRPRRSSSCRRAAPGCLR